jgi:hypothetical protein
MRLFALALKLDENYFDTTIDKNISMMRVLQYPKQTTAPLPGQLRAGAHSDYGSMTILRKELSDAGLQVKNKAGEWVNVPVIEGSFIVNIGDLMQQWTNDQWTSTMHRVINPPPDSEENKDRLSRVLPSAELRCHGRMPAELPIAGRAGQIRADQLGRSSPQQIRQANDLRQRLVDHEPRCR